MVQTLLLYMYMSSQGYGGALSRHMILLLLLEFCRHICGLWVVTVQLCLRSEYSQAYVRYVYMYTQRRAFLYVQVLIMFAVDRS